jgi:maltooligosyltrehalose trehalohydrolase
MKHERELSLGASYAGNGVCHFCVWAPLAQRVDVHLLTSTVRLVALEPGEHGYCAATVNDVLPGSLYRYRLDGDKERPDPASHSQPQGLHGPSEVVDPAFAWHDQSWSGLPLGDYVIYELHVGTFTSEGTFDAIIAHLDDLKDLGITAIELMPLAQFPGQRNWGYDGASPFAVQNSHGGPAGLKRLVDAAHGRGLSVVLDVVYNHLGPEGNYLWDYGPYFTDRYKTPWGPALNFDGPDSDEVRRYFLENALRWQSEFHIDALRLDAIHAIQDHSAYPFLEELGVVTAEQAERLKRRFYLIAESNLNDARVIRPRALGGLGMHSQWCDDFHHSLRTLLTGEHTGYYQDFGKIEHLVRAYRDAFVYSGQYSPFRKRRHGNSAHHCAGQQFVVCSQNHDQVGNRMLGDRLSASVSFDSLKLAAAAVLLSPYVPLLFMGEEYGETVPFLFFTDHSDPGLIKAVRKGRREEFASFRWHGEAPDPQDPSTFQRSKLRHELRQQEKHRVLRAFYQELLRTRKALPALAGLDRESLEAVGFEKEKTVFVRRWSDADEVFFALHLGEQPVTIKLPAPAGSWRKQLDSAETRWLGSGRPAANIIQSTGEVALTLDAVSVVLYRRED